MAKKSKNILAETRQFVEFLEKRLASKNYKANVPAEEYARGQSATLAVPGNTA